jgi:toxin ParE1/3/4
MSHTLEVSAPAADDLAHAIDWYGRIRSGLAADFVLCVEEAIDRITQNPHAYPTVFRNVRRALIHRFPYGVIYRVSNSHIQVEAFFPDSKDPRALRRRLV